MTIKIQDLVNVVNVSIVTMSTLLISGCILIYSTLSGLA